MKKLLCIFLFSLSFLFNQAFAEWGVIETPYVTIESIPIDAEHMVIFDDFIIDFIDIHFDEEKTFEDGDSYTQKLVGLKLDRIDKLPSTERYIVIFMFEVKRFINGNAQYTEEFLYQLVYFDVDPNNLKNIRVHIFEGVDISQFLKKEI